MTSGEPPGASLGPATCVSCRRYRIGLLVALAALLLSWWLG